MSDQRREGTPADEPDDLMGYHDIPLPLIPARAEERGAVRIYCPHCREKVLFSQATEAFVARAGRVKCACGKWSVGGLAVEGEGE